MIPVPYAYNAIVLDVHDGDTIRCRVDRGFRDYSEWPIRLVGCAARELSEPGGKDARDNLRTLLPVGTQVLLHTLKPDKFGDRKDALVTVEVDGKELDLATYLISEGWAVEWTGQGTQPKPVWPRSK